jgi:hypothetical protein
VEKLVCGRRELREVIVERHRGIAPVARDVNEFCALVDRQRVVRQMRFEKAPMRLRFRSHQRLLDRAEQAHVGPGREVPNRPSLGALEHKHTYNALHPGRAAFGVRGDDDVVGARAISGPPRTIEHT